MKRERKTSSRGEMGNLPVNIGNCDVFGVVHVGALFDDLFGPEGGGVTTCDPGELAVDRILEVDDVHIPIAVEIYANDLLRVWNVGSAHHSAGFVVAVGASVWRWGGSNHTFVCVCA